MDAFDDGDACAKITFAEYGVNIFEDGGRVPELSQDCGCRS